MQSSNRISLNALRAFLMAARHKSFKTAASDLGVTPGAVSHQVRQLEGRLGVLLFSRSNNGITLTEAGVRLARDAQPGLSLLEGALDHLTRQSQCLCVAISPTFAARFLIPRLDRFERRNRDATIRFETLQDDQLRPESNADIVIAYVPGDRSMDGDMLFADACRPYLAPALLEKLGPAPDLSDVPVLQCARNNWDWKLWLERSGRSDQLLNFGSQFDLDDSGLRAAAAGLGMVLASDFLVADDLVAGRLVALPGAPDVVLGHYMIQHRTPETALARTFSRWLVRECRRA
ncbi:MAG: LysR family transcriptional regulator [Pseudomonadota bacterium]